MPDGNNNFFLSDVIFGKNFEMFSCNVFPNEEVFSTKGRRCSGRERINA